MRMKSVVFSIFSLVFMLLAGQASAADIVLVCKFTNGDEDKVIINDGHIMLNGEVKQLFNNKPVEISDNYILFYTVISKSRAGEWTIDRGTGKIIVRDFFIKEQRRGAPGGPGYFEGSCEKADAATKKF